MRFTESIRALRAPRNDYRGARLTVVSSYRWRATPCGWSQLGLDWLPRPQLIVNKGDCKKDANFDRVGPQSAEGTLPHPREVYSRYALDATHSA